MKPLHNQLELQKARNYTDKWIGYVHVHNAHYLFINRLCAGEGVTLTPYQIAHILKVLSGEFEPTVNEAQPKIEVELIIRSIS